MVDQRRTPTGELHQQAKMRKIAWTLAEVTIFAAIVVIFPMHHVPSNYGAYSAKLRHNYLGTQVQTILL